MSFALSSGVTGMQAHQQMLDVAGNNLANVNTTAFKSSRILFSELLSETIRKASQPTGTTGGTNPVQMGSGVGVAGISPNMAQGNIVNTGNPLDLAIEGEGYFVLNDGQQKVYSRAGAFAVDQDNYLVDPATGYRVQRYIGSASDEEETSDLIVPYNETMQPTATSNVTVAGNLSSDAALTTPNTNVLTMSIGYTTGNGTAATEDSLVTELDQYSAGSGTALDTATIQVTGFAHDGTALSSNNRITAATAFTVSSTAADDTAALSSLDQFTAGTLTSATITIGGTNHDGTALSDGLPMSVSDTTTIDDLIDHINTVLDAGGTAGANGVASLVDGRIVVTDAEGGASQTAITLTFANSGTADLTLPSSFTSAGPLSVTSTTTLGDVIDHINSVLGTSGTATLVNGKIRITDAASGYSLSDVGLTFANSGTATVDMPSYFEITTVGGDEVKNVNINVYDANGGSHVLSAAFVRTETANTWDMVLTSITGSISQLNDRRISGVNFSTTNGSYMGLSSTTEQPEFEITFANIADAQTINVAMGTAGELDGLTQFAGNSTAVAREQDGYGYGRLSTVSVNKEGVLVGAYSNGIKKEIGTVQIALFQNPSGLENIGGSYFIPSANSGEAMATLAQSGGSGTVHGGALEKSNADVATEFINLIQAQNGFQANSRTIVVANQILQELSTLIR